MFVDFTGCVTPFVRWIEDYPLPDRLKMPSHVGFYDGKGGPDNYLYLFEGAIRMQKAGSIVNYKDLKAKFWSHFSQQKKFTKTHLAVHNIKQIDQESTRAFVTRYTDDTLQILGLHEEQRISGFVHGLKTRSLVEFLSTDLPTTYKGLMEKTYTWIEAKEVATNGAPGDHKEGFDKFNKDFSWDNNKGRKKNQDKFSPYKGSNHGLLANLSKNPREILATKKAAKAFEQPPRMVENRRSRNMSKGNYLPPVSGFDNSSDPVIIKLKPSIRSLRVDSKIPLVRFSGEHSWPLGEVPLKVTVGESPYTRTETLNFVSVKSNSPYNLLLRRTTMQKIRIVLSTIHAAIKFHTPCGIGNVFSTYEPNKVEEEQKKVKETISEATQDVLSCVDAKERIIVNDNHLKQTFVIGKQLPTSFKRKLQDLLRSNADKRGLAPERNEAACKEVDELTKAGILREVKYQTWVANRVMVKKSDRGWRMCVDFTDINKAYPKDCYPLPEID
ncbi:hypothetical protein Tco_0039042 [Tanacetum coccineum]